jgi:peptide/nickel transport system permease protein
MNDAKDSNDDFSLDDERRFRVLSPSTLVAKRFFANRLALTGLIIIIAMFLFSFAGALFSPYGQSEVFTKYEKEVKTYAHAAYNDSIIITTPNNYNLDVMERGSIISAISKKQKSVQIETESFNIKNIGNESYLVLDKNNKPVCLASKLVVSSLKEGYKPDFATLAAFEETIAKGDIFFTDSSGEIFIVSSQKSSGDKFYFAENEKNKNAFFASRLSIQSVVSGSVISLPLRIEIYNAVTDLNGSEKEFAFEGTNYIVGGTNGQYTIKTEQSTLLVNLFESPSAKHWLGTDKAGMDVVVRLMYGGRISLLIGFVVIIIDTFIGVVAGGISGYFGKLIDMLIMRLVDILNCIPALPLYIIIGAFMDGNKVDTNIRIYILMLIMGFMSWPSVARIVRGQILSLREQEFMLAAEALGLKTSHRIFRHLLPNVIPQLIVLATMGLGDVILAESVLSFLGIGVKFPLASWGNILNSVNDVHVMTNYLYVWLPAGFCILITVLGFNFIGDGLRDAFDPKTKR